MMKILSAHISNGNYKHFFLGLNGIGFTYDFPCLRASPSLRVETLCLVFMVLNDLSSHSPSL